VPEIADGLVEIQNVAREPGYRSKIAVVSHAGGVDPVGACVGPRGSRVRMVVSELRGEKIDIIPFNEEPARFVAKALSPARVREVLVDDENKQATVIVPDDQLSLAIGKEGQNARLAARLTGWRIDIKSETQFAEEGRRPAATPAAEEATAADVGQPEEAVADQDAAEPEAAESAATEPEAAESAATEPEAAEAAADGPAAVEPEAVQREAAEAEEPAAEAEAEPEPEAADGGSEGA
jgi:N utilization substance protein A